MSGLAIRAMRRDEVGIALDWAAVEGWNPGHDDGEAFFAADPGGFLVGELDGRPAATISVVAYGAAYGFLGFYIVRPELRGQGHGRALWQAGMARLGGRTVGLDGVVARETDYRRSGFVTLHRNIRYGGPAPIAGSWADGIVTLADGGAGLARAVTAYDRPFFGGPRDAFLTGWIAPPRRTAVALSGGSVRGYGTVRPCRTGHKIGPLFADDPDTAERLFAALAGGLAGDVFLDLPEPNLAARSLAERHGLAPSFETVRMYRGPAPALPLARTYGITSFELG